MNQQNTRSQPPILFFSPGCPHCKDLLRLLQTDYSVMMNVIKIVNVHDNVDRLPKNLQSLPTIMHNGSMIEGPAAFNWVQFHAQQLSAQQSAQSQQPSQNQNQQPPQSKQPPQSRQPPEDAGEPTALDLGTSKISMDYEPLPGERMGNNTMSNFDYLPGAGQQVNGFQGINAAAASDPNNSKSVTKSNGMAEQLEQLQNLRSMEENERMSQPRQF